MRNVRRDLPRGYHRRLPRAGRERARRASRSSRTICSRTATDVSKRRECPAILAAFQTVAPLSIGELWAWPSVLKLALLGACAITPTSCWRRARRASRAPSSCTRSMPRRRRTALPPLPATFDVPFVVQLVQRLREYGSTVAPLRAALDERLGQEGPTLEEAIRNETQRQATEQISVANIFTSLRFCATEDWREVFEGASLVEHVLQRDPGGIYAAHGFLEPRPLPARRRVARRAARRGPARHRPPLRRDRPPRGGPRRRRQPRRPRRRSPDRQAPRRFAATLPASTRLLDALRAAAFRHATPLYLGALACRPPARMAAAAWYATGTVPRGS